MHIPTTVCPLAAPQCLGEFQDKEVERMLHSARRRILIIDSDREFADDVAALLEGSFGIESVSDFYQVRSCEPCSFDLIIVAEDFLTEWPGLRRWLAMRRHLKGELESSAPPETPPVLLLASRGSTRESTDYVISAVTIRYPGPGQILSLVEGLLAPNPRPGAPADRAPRC